MVIQATEPRIITPVVWYEELERLIVEQACWLSGWNLTSMREIIEEGDVVATWVG